MYDQENIFAKIIRGEIPSDKVYEDNDVLAFKDVNPAAPVHALVIPKGEYISFNDFAINATPDIVANFFRKVREIAVNELGLEEDGYRIVFNHGKNASQTVFHFHVHILGGKPLGGLIASDSLKR
jgi:histidine triad (HIT) family protein